MIKGKLIKTSYKKIGLSDSSFVDGFLRIVAYPICAIFGLQIEIGKEVTEKAIPINSIVAVSGRVKEVGSGFSIVPEFLTGSLAETIYSQCGKYARYFLFQAFFVGMSVFCYRKALKRNEELSKARGEIQAVQDLKCPNCQKRCEVLNKPCMHISFCRECAQGARMCAVCDRVIEEKVPLHLLGGV